MHRLSLVPQVYVIHQIVPHKSVLNSQNKRLWSVLHELLQLRDGPRIKTSFGGVRILPRDDLWWIVRMECAEETRITFYLAVAYPFADVLKLRLANHAQWSKNTLRESEYANIRMPHDAACADIRLTRDNMFSLRCDHAEQTSPIRNLLDVSHQLLDGDTLQLMFRFSPVPRVEGAKTLAESWKTWEKGGVPKRNRDYIKQAKDASVSGLVHTANGTVALVNDVVEAVEGSFFAKRKETLKPIQTIERSDPERTALTAAGSLSHETKSKAHASLYRSTLFALANSDNALRRSMLLQSVQSAFADLSGDNRMVARTVRVDVAMVCQLKAPLIDRDPMLLSADEVAKLTQLPTADLQEEYKESLERNTRVEIEVPSYFTDEKGIYMGEVTRKDVQTAIYLPTASKDALFTPRAFVASPRMGKDTAIVNFLVEAKKHHDIGCIILDAIDERGNDRGMSDGVRDSLNPADVIDLNLGDYDHPIYLGLQGIASTTNARMASNRIAQELTSFLMGDDVDGRMADYLFAIAKSTNADPVLIRATLTRPEVRLRIISETTDDDVRQTLADYDAMTVGMQMQIANPVLVRLGKILRDDFLRPIFGQRYNSDVDFGAWIRDGKAVIVRIPTRDLGPAAVRTLMHWLTMVTFLTKVAGCGGETFVVFNEPHIYESPGWLSFVERMLLEGPKYRIAPIFAFHTFAKLSKRLGDTLLASGANWHVGNNSSLDVFERLKDVLQPTFTPENAREQLKRGQFIAAWRDDEGEYQPAFLYGAPLPISKRQKMHDNSTLTIEHSKKYGEPLDDVLNDIRKR